MDQITHDIRLEGWKDVIRQCHARPKGQTIKDWCAQNNVSEKQFYYWQRQIRLLIAEGMTGALVPAAPYLLLMIRMISRLRPSYGKEIWS